MDDFDQVCDRVDACEGVKTNFLFVDGNMPRTNEVDANFVPQENGSTVGCELSCLTRRCSNLWADFAIKDYFFTYLTEVRMVEIFVE